MRLETRARDVGARPAQAPGDQAAPSRPPRVHRVTRLTSMGLAVLKGNSAQAMSIKGIVR